MASCSTRRVVLHVVEARGLKCWSSTSSSAVTPSPPDSFVLVRPPLPSPPTASPSPKGTGPAMPSASTTSGTSTPRATAHKTRVVKKSSCPVWDQWFVLDLSPTASQVSVEAVQYNFLSSDKSIGVGVVTVPPNGSSSRCLDQWLSLVWSPPLSVSGAQAPQVSGEIHCRVLQVDAEEDPTRVFLRHKASTQYAALLNSTPAGVSQQQGGGTSNNSTIAATDTTTTPRQQVESEPSSAGMVDIPLDSPTRHTESPEGFAEPQPIAQRPGSASTPSLRMSFADRLSMLPKLLSPLLPGGGPGSGFGQPPSPASSPSAGGSPARPMGHPRRRNKDYTTPRMHSRHRSSKGFRNKSSSSVSSGGGEGKLLGPITRGLIDSFFVVGHGDLEAELEDRINEAALDNDGILSGSGIPFDPLEMAYAAEITFEFPELEPGELSPSAWMFCLPEGLLLRRSPGKPSIFSFTLTTSESRRKYVTCLSVWEPLELPVAEAISRRSFADPSPNTTGEPSSKPVFVQRCFCLVSSMQCFTFCRAWLQAFLVRLDQPDFNIEMAVASLVRSVPLPIAGGTPVSALLSEGKTAEAQLPAVDGLPLCDAPLRALFGALSLENVLDVFRCLLLEEKVLMVSRSKTLLVYACEALQALLYPLCWPYVYVPVLPRHLLDYLHSPTPFLIGIPAQYLADVDFSAGAEVVFVDLDKDTVRLAAPVDTPGQLPLLPICESFVLRQDLFDLCAPECDKMDAVDWRPWNDDHISHAEFNLRVRAIFLRFFCTLLAGYRDHILYLRVFPEPIAVLDKENFLRSSGRRGDPFMTRLLEAQAFTTFLECHKHSRGNAFDDSLLCDSWKEDTIAVFADRLRPSASASAPPTAAPIALKWSLSGMELDSPLKEVINARLGAKKPGDIDIEVIAALPFPPLVTKPNPPPPPLRVIVRRTSTGVTLLKRSQPGQHLRLSAELVNAQSSSFMEPVAAVVSAVLSESGEVDPSKVSDLSRLLETEKGRIEFGRALLAAAPTTEDGTRPPRKLEQRAFEVIGDLVRVALKEACVQGDFLTPPLFIDVAETYFHVIDGASAFVWIKLQGLEIWSSPEFWDSLFFVKAHRLCSLMYKPTIGSHMNAWASKNREERNAVTDTEMEAIFTLLSDLVFKMSSLGVDHLQLHKFAAAMCNKTLLDDERRKTFLQLVKNVSKIRL